MAKAAPKAIAIRVLFKQTLLDDLKFGCGAKQRRTQAAFPRPPTRQVLRANRLCGRRAVSARGMTGIFQLHHGYVTKPRKAGALKNAGTTADSGLLTDPP